MPQGSADSKCAEKVFSWIRAIWLRANMGQCNIGRSNIGQHYSVADKNRYKRLRMNVAGCCGIHSGRPQVFLNCGVSHVYEDNISSPKSTTSSGHDFLHESKCRPATLAEPNFFVSLPIYEN